MKLRRVILTLASVGLSAALIVLLIRIGKINVWSTWQRVESTSPIIFIKLILLNALLVFLSDEKWRNVDTALRNVSDSVPSRTASFGVSSAGMALGLVLPVQIGMTTARTIGTYFYGSPLKRGTAGTLLEQSFNLLVVIFLTVASGVTWLIGGGAAVWTLCGAAMVMLTWLAIGPLVRLIRWLASYLTDVVSHRNRRWSILQSFSELMHSDALKTALTRRLVILSAARFVVVVLMAGETAEAIGAPIPLWHMAAAIPFVFLASVIGITPGGIGVNELAAASALSIFGTPFSVGAQWALANRVLVIASCLAVAASAATLVGFKKLVQSFRPGQGTAGA